MSQRLFLGYQGAPSRVIVIFHYTKVCARPYNGPYLLDLFFDSVTRSLDSLTGLLLTRSELVCGCPNLCHLIPF